MNKAAVILFKPDGKYYTEEEWRIPERIPDWSEVRGNYFREVLGPYDMRHSRDFHTIDGGPVLVVTQEPWGYPFLIVQYVVTKVKWLRTEAGLISQ